MFYSVQSCEILKSHEVRVCEGDYVGMMDSDDFFKTNIIRNALLKGRYDQFYKITQDSSFVNTLFYNIPFEDIPKEILYTFYVFNSKGKKYEGQDFYSKLYEIYESCQDSLYNNYFINETIVYLKKKKCSATISLFSDHYNNLARLRIIQQNILLPYLDISIKIPNNNNVARLVLKKINFNTCVLSLIDLNEKELLSFYMTLKRVNDMNSTGIWLKMIVSNDNEYYIFRNNDTEYFLTPKNAQEIFDKYLSMIEIKE